MVTKERVGEEVKDRLRGGDGGGSVQKRMLIASSFMHNHNVCILLTIHKPTYCQFNGNTLNIVSTCYAFFTVIQWYIWCISS